VIVQEPEFAGQANGDPLSCGGFRISVHSRVIEPSPVQNSGNLPAAFDQRTAVAI